MALLVTDNGEIDSLRNLLNYNQEIPRNLILKLFTTNTYPNESDTPSQTAYYEPYTNNNTLGYGNAPVTGYPQVINNRTDQDYANQYGILLNGNKWTIETLQNAAVTVQGSGVAAEYTITVAANTGIKKGDYVTGGSVGTGAYVVDIDGLTLLLSVKNTGTFTNQNLDFGQGRTTASYPEETFTFSGAAGDVYGYMLVRANNMPTTIHGVEDAATISAATTISKTGVRGTIGNNYIRLAAITNTTTVTGSSGEFQITVGSTAGLEAYQRVTGTGIAAGARIAGITGTTVYLTKANTGAVSGNGTFQAEVGQNLTVGMRVSQTATAGVIGGAPNGIDANTIITGIDHETDDANGTVIVYLNNVLIDNIQPSNSNDEVDFDFSKVTATGHGLVKGDTVYIDQGTGNTTTTPGTYTVFNVIDANTFTTTKALDGTGDATLYSAIFFAERFTNGPYAIQNAGDQIKVTLNVSLD
jgi:hypothetical protein